MVAIPTCAVGRRHLRKSRLADVRTFIRAVAKDTGVAGSARRVAIAAYNDLSAQARRAI